MRFSIIIPVQKSDWFRLSLASLLNQSFPKTDYEIIIVDDSGGNVRSLISQLQIQLKGFLWSYCLCGHGSGRSAARNKGLQQASGEVVLFLDDDMIASPGLLAAHDQYQQRGFSVVMECKPNNTLSIWFPGWFESIAFNSRKLILDSQKSRLITYIDYHPEDITTTVQPILTSNHIFEDFGQVYQLTYSHENMFHTLFGDELEDLCIPWITGGSSNLAVRRDLAWDVGGFDEIFTGWGLEDLEFEYRLHQAGAHFAIGSKATTFHQLHPRHWREMMRSTISNYKRFYQKHPTLQVQLFVQYRMGDLTIQSYNDTARREQIGCITPTEISAAREYYECFALMDEDALAEKWVQSALGPNNWYEKRAGTKPIEGRSMRGNPQHPKN